MFRKQSLFFSNICFRSKTDSLRIPESFCWCVCFSTLNKSSKIKISAILFDDGVKWCWHISGFLRTNFFEAFTLWESIYHSAKNRYLLPRQKLSLSAVSLNSPFSFHLILIWCKQSCFLRHHTYSTTFVKFVPGKACLESWSFHLIKKVEYVFCMLLFAIPISSNNLCSFVIFFTPFFKWNFYA